jgi:hypothetical protein
VIFGLIAETRQRIQGWDYLENDIPTPAAITAIRTTARRKLFAVEMDHAVTTATRTYVNPSLIDEHMLSAKGFVMKSGFKPDSRLHAA